MFFSSKSITRDDVLGATACLPRNWSTGPHTPLGMISGFVLYLDSSMYVIKLQQLSCSAEIHNANLLSCCWFLFQGPTWHSSTCPKKHSKTSPFQHSPSCPCDEVHQVSSFHLYCMPKLEQWLCRIPARAPTGFSYFTWYDKGLAQRCTNFLYSQVLTCTCLFHIGQ